MFTKWLMLVAWTLVCGLAGMAVRHLSDPKPHPSLRGAPSIGFTLTAEEKQVVYICAKYVMPDDDPRKAQAVANIERGALDARQQAIPNMITYRRAILLCITNDPPEAIKQQFPRLKDDAKRLYARETDTCAR